MMIVPYDDKPVLLKDDATTNKIKTSGNHSTNIDNDKSESLLKFNNNFYNLIFNNFNLSSLFILIVALLFATIIKKTQIRRKGNNAKNN